MATTLESVLKKIGEVLPKKLEPALVPGYHGVVTLTVHIQDGRAAHIKTGDDQVHRLDTPSPAIVTRRK